jgi:hypothetical protein
VPTDDEVEGTCIACWGSRAEAVADKIPAKFRRPA